MCSSRVPSIKISLSFPATRLVWWENYSRRPIFNNDSFWGFIFGFFIGLIGWLVAVERGRKPSSDVGRLVAGLTLAELYSGSHCSWSVYRICTSNATEYAPPRLLQPPKLSLSLSLSLSPPLSLSLSLPTPLGIFFSATLPPTYRGPGRERLRTDAVGSQFYKRLGW